MKLFSKKIKKIRRQKGVEREEASVTRQKMTEEEMIEKFSQLELVACRIEKMRLGEYVTNMTHPWRLIWLNLISGIAKGVGLTIGATLVIALLFKLLTGLIAMKIPYLTELLQEVVQIIQTTPGVEKFVPPVQPVGGEPLSPDVIKMEVVQPQ